MVLQEIWNGLHARPFESTLASELSAPVMFDNALPQLGYKHLAQHIYRAKARPGKFKSIEGLENID